MRHFSLWYLEVKVHGLIMLKSPEVPSNTCPTSLRERRMIKSLYNIEFFRSRKNWIREESLYIKHYFLYFCMFLTTAAGCQSQQILVWPTEAILAHLLKYMRILKGSCSHSVWVWVSLELTQNIVLSGDTPLIQGKHHLLISTFCSSTLPGKHAWQKQSGSFCDCI